MGLNTTQFFKSGLVGFSTPVLRSPEREDLAGHFLPLQPVAADVLEVLDY